MYILNEGGGREKIGGYKSLLSGKSLVAEWLEQASQWHEMSWSGGHEFCTWTKNVIIFTDELVGWATNLW